MVNKEPGSFRIPRGDTKSTMTTLMAIAEGNMGAFNVLCDIYFNFGGYATITEFIKLGIVGERLYKLWNDCLERNTLAMVALISCVDTGAITEKELQDSADNSKQIDVTALLKEISDGTIHENI